MAIVKTKVDKNKDSSAKHHKSNNDNNSNWNKNNNKYEISLPSKRTSPIKYW